jgi:hypothetical protein
VPELQTWTRVTLENQPLSGESSHRHSMQPTKVKDLSGTKRSRFTAVLYNRVANRLSLQERYCAVLQPDSTRESLAAKRAAASNPPFRPNRHRPLADPMRRSSAGSLRGEG